MAMISEDILTVAGMSEPEFLKEIAVFIFQLEKVTLAKAAEIAGLSRLEFQKLLAERNIPLHYDVAEFREDVKTLKQIPR